MLKRDLSEEELEEICEDAFVSLKEVCIRLQERTGCNDDVVISMLGSVSEFYLSKGELELSKVIVT